MPATCSPTTSAAESRNWLTITACLQLRRLAKEHPIMLTVEEGSIGGFASHVMQFLTLSGLLDGGLKFRPMTLPDRCARPLADVRPTCCA